MDALAELSPDAISVGFLEPGWDEALPDGWVHEKLAPATTIAIAHRGHYEVHSAGTRTIAREGEAFLAQDRAALKIIHHAPRASETMGAFWLHARFMLFHTIDLISLFDLPPKLDVEQAAPLGAAIRELRRLRLEGAVLGRLPRHARKMELAFETLRLIATQAPVNQAGLGLLKHAERLAPVLSFINRHLAEPLEIEDLARVAHLSRSRFFAFFREHMGLAPMEFVKKVRLVEAQQRLITTDAKLSAIAEATGFSNPFHLSREFKRLVGLAPVEFRKQHRSLDV